VVDLVLEYAGNETLAKEVDLFALERVELNSELRGSLDQA
jgi:hypothetical protein